MQREGEREKGVEKKVEGTNIKVSTLIIFVGWNIMDHPVVLEDDRCLAW